MPQSTLDRELRLLVSTLAGFHPDDAARVLDDLDSDQRRRVDVLLMEFGGTGARDMAPPIEPTPNFDRSRFSSWLIDLLDDTNAVITPLARERLRAAAVRHCPLADANASARRAGLATRMVAHLWPARGAP